jgi:hypothetical protein
MTNYFKTDSSRLKLYMTENNGWQKTLTEQSNEIPLMEKMLVDAIIKAEMLEEEEIGVDIHFRQQLVKQQEALSQLNNELGIQQQRLSADSISNSDYDTHALCSQDILRDRIKEVEKSYVELKCNFMKYLSTVL